MSKAYSLIDIPDHKEECSRCFGTGRIAIYHMIEGGICFKCKGTGLQWDGTFKAKYAGYCRSCNAPIKEGDHVKQNPRGKGVICSNC